MEAAAAFSGSCFLAWGSWDASYFVSKAKGGLEKIENILKWASKHSVLYLFTRRFAKQNKRVGWSEKNFSTTPLHHRSRRKLALSSRSSKQACRWRPGGTTQFQDHQNDGISSLSIFTLISMLGVIILIIFPKRIEKFKKSSKMRQKFTQNTTFSTE